MPAKGSYTTSDSFRDIISAADKEVEYRISFEFKVAADQIDDLDHEDIIKALNSYGDLRITKCELLVGDAPGGLCQGTA